MEVVTVSCPDAQLFDKLDPKNNGADRDWVSIIIIIINFLFVTLTHMQL